MAKTKLAICFGDKEYQRRFVKCFMHHYESQYEVHVFGTLSELKQSTERDFQMLLLEGVEEKELRDLEETKKCLVCLTEVWNTSDVNQKEQVLYVSKYQEVYKIEQQMKENLLEQLEVVGDRGETRKKGKWIGVFSLECEEYQIPFCGMVAAEYGENYETLMLNLQPASGLGVLGKEDNESLSIEDLLAAVATDNYTKNRLLGGIAHEPNWDYVYPARNSVCLTEASGQMYEMLLDVLSYELGYECIILNFGAIFPDVFTLMEKCETLYFLVSDKEAISWREKEFGEELLRQGKEEVLLNAVRVKFAETLQPSGDWRCVAQSLRWSSTGDQLRKYRQMEKSNG